MPTSRWPHRALVAIALAAITALAVWTRSVDRSVVFRPAGVVFYGGDASYHMRRIAYGLERFPRHLAFDPYLHHPEGAPAIWPPLFDVAVTGVLRIAGATALERAEHWAAWVPVVLGSATVTAIAFVGRQLLGSWLAGLLAAFLLSILGGHVRYSRVGLLDHHVALGLAVLATLSIGAALLRRQRSDARSWLIAAGFGTALGGSILLWPGCLLFMALWQPIQWLSVQTRPPDERRLGLRLAFGAHLVATVLLAFGCSGSPWVERGELTLTTLSWLQPIIVGALMLAWGVASMDLRKAVPGEKSAASSLFRSLLGYGAVLILFSGVAATFAPMRSSVTAAWGWLAKDETFQASVAESKPLFFRDDGLGFGAFAHEMFSWAASLVPILAIALLIVGIRRRDPGRLVLAIFTLALFGVTLLQARFADMASVPVALTLASAAGATVARRFGRWQIAWMAAVIVGTWPCWTPIREQASRSIEDQGSPRLSASDLYPLVLYGTARWIRENTPETVGFFDASERPEYGLMCWWDLGHVLQYTARRPTVVDNFGDDLGGDNFEDALLFHRLEEEAAAEALLDRYRARYVVTRITPETSRRAEHLRRVVTRLHHFDGLGIAVDEVRLPALAGFRLIYESRRIVLENQPEQVGRTPAAYKVFEHVPGAILTGSAPPDTRVQCGLRLTTNRNRALTWIAETLADANGHYSIRVPYATETDAAQARASGLVEVRTANGTISVAVPEAAVREGRTIEAR